MENIHSDYYYKNQFENFYNSQSNEILDMKILNISPYYFDMNTIFRRERSYEYDIQTDTITFYLRKNIKVNVIVRIKKVFCLDINVELGNINLALRKIETLRELFDFLNKIDFK